MARASWPPATWFACSSSGLISATRAYWPRMPGELPSLLAAWCRSRAAEGPPTGISCLIWPTATSGSSAY
eukprot:8608544-Lingulodinium_polyedra.AAC.1